MVTVTSDALRVSEYFIAPGSFGGTVFDLTLDQPLAADYFAVVQGSAGDTSACGDRDPEADYARLTQDPFGTGDLARLGAAPTCCASSAATARDSWVGVVTVVECLANCGTAGFNLLTVEEVLHAGAIGFWQRHRRHRLDGHQPGAPDGRLQRRGLLLGRDDGPRPPGVPRAAVPLGERPDQLDA